MLRGLLITILFISSAVAQYNDTLSDTLKYRIEEPNRFLHDSWLSQDKFLHFSACASIVGLSYHTLVCRLNRDENQGKIYSISLTAIIGIGKEVYDKKKKKHFSWKDICWDGAGLMVGYFAFVHKY